MKYDNGNFYIGFYIGWVFVAIGALASLAAKNYLAALWAVVAGLWILVAYGRSK